MILLWQSVEATERAVLLAREWDGLDITWHYRRDLLELFRECGYIGELPRPAGPTTLASWLR